MRISTTSGDETNTDELLNRAGDDTNARHRLLQRHRDRLRRMVAVRLDRRVAVRVSPSDVVQEALATAADRLEDYLKERPIAFYPWLRKIAWERLAKLHRRHIAADRRSVIREENAPLPDESALELADRLVARTGSPSKAAVREELRRRVRFALAELPERDREVLVLRFLEQLSTAETASILEISDGAVKQRQLRALEKLRSALDEGTAI